MAIAQWTLIRDWERLSTEQCPIGVKRNAKIQQ